MVSSKSRLMAGDSGASGLHSGWAATAIFCRCLLMPLCRMILLQFPLLASD